MSSEESVTASNGQSEIAENVPFTFDTTIYEPPKLKGHLRVVPKDDYKPGERLVSHHLNYLLDGVNIGERLVNLKIEIGAQCVVSAEITLYITDIEIDLPDTDLEVCNIALPVRKA